jgi:5'(3')-deoxyribonucleotidase
MGKPVVAVDIDDTLADHAEAFVAWSNAKYGTALTAADYQDRWALMWRIDEAQAEERSTAFHGSGVHRSMVAKTDSQGVLGRLKDRYEFVIVTARRRSVVADSLEWLTEFHPGTFADVRFVPIWEPGNTLTKAVICREIGAEYLIDDMPRHCEAAAAEGIHALLFGDYSWNRSAPTAAGVQRVRDWLEVEEYFRGR